MLTVVNPAMAQRSAVRAVRNSDDTHHTATLRMARALRYPERRSEVCERRGMTRVHAAGVRLDTGASVAAGRRGLHITRVPSAGTSLGKEP